MAIVAAITSNVELADAPGNVFVAGAAGGPRPATSVVNVSQLLDASTAAPG